jgi:hypothetical protein
VELVPIKRYNIYKLYNKGFGGFIGIYRYFQLYHYVSPSNKGRHIVLV